MLLNCVKDFKYNLQNTGYTASNNWIDNHSKTFCDELMIDLNSMNFKKTADLFDNFV